MLAYIHYTIREHYEQPHKAKVKTVQDELTKEQIEQYERLKAQGEIYEYERNGIEYVSVTADVMNDE